MEKIPNRRASAFTEIKGTSLSPQLASPSRQNATSIPTVGSVAEKFNFGLKQLLKKAENDKQELQTKYQELLKSLESISCENDKLKSSHFGLQQDKIALESKYQKLKSHTDVMKADYDRVNAKLSDLEVANESLKQTSWMRQSKKGKGKSTANSQDAAAMANEISTLKENLVKKDSLISKLEKEVETVQEKLKQTVLEHQRSESIKIKVEDANIVDEVDMDSHKTVMDHTVMKSLDKKSVLTEYKKLLANYNKKELELEESQDRILKLEKSCGEQRKELALLNMEVSKVKGDRVLSGSHNALHDSPLLSSSAVPILGLPISVSKSASFDNGRRISLPSRQEAAGSPDVSVLQHCLKLSLAEKKSLEEEVKELKQQIFSLQHEQSSGKPFRSQSVNSSIPSPSSSIPKSSRSQSTVVSPKACEDIANKSLKGDISMLQSCLQLAITEKKALGEENKTLKTELVEWKQKVQTLEAKLAELEKSIPKTEELNKLKASVQSLEKENSELSDNEKKMRSRVKSLDTKKAQLVAEKAQLVTDKAQLVTEKTQLVTEKTKLMEEIEKLKQKLTSLNEKEKQQKTVEMHQSTAERSVDRNRPGSADSKKVMFYRSSSQNSDLDVQPDPKKTQPAESPTPVEHKKIQISEGQASEMKVACRLNITSHSPSAPPSSERHSKLLHTKSLTSDYGWNKSSKHSSDSTDGESNDNKYLSASQPASSKPAVTSVKVSTSIKKETPTKINTLHLKSNSPQLHLHSTSLASGTSQSHTPTVASHSPTHSTVTAHSSSSRVMSGVASPGGGTSHSVHLGTKQQQSVAHISTTSHATSSAVSQPSVTSSPSSTGTTQSSTIITTSLQTMPSTKPRPFFKSSTMMSFVTSSKPSGSPSYSPVIAQKSTTTTVPTTVITSPPKSNTDSSASREATRPPLQKTSSLTVNSNGTEVIRRRTKPRSQQVLDPMKRSSAYFPTDVASQSITEENELHRFGSLESLKSALFQAASAKVHPSVASSSVSTTSNVTTVNATSSSTTTSVTRSTSFSSPAPKVVSFSKIKSSESKFETKPAEAIKEVKFVNGSQQSSTRARPRAARHQSINTALPPVSSYYSPSTPARYVFSYVFVSVYISLKCDTCFKDGRYHFKASVFESS